MRRPSIACPRAAPSLPGAPPDHVWISDHLLSAAVSRFFRISCPHQKRHGSNVPGPLEARRRAAKRRMTLQANYDPSAGMSAPLFNLASLFGHRRPGEPHWTYEPPSLRKAELSDFASNIACRPPPDGPIPESAYGFHQPPDTISRTTPPSSFPCDWTLNASLKLEQAVSTENTPTPQQYVGHNHSLDQVIRPRAEVEQAAFPDKHSSRRDTLSSREASAQTKPVPDTWIDRKNLNACFGRFCELVDDVPSDIKDQPQDFLSTVFWDCYPDSLLTEDLDSGRAEHFCVLVYRHLRENQWPVQSIHKCLSDPDVRLPNIFSPQGLLFLQHLDADDLKLTNDRPAKVLIFKRLVSQLQDPSYTRSWASTCNDHDRYASLRLLVRGLWHAAIGPGYTFDTSAAAALRATALELQDDDFSNLLCKFWEETSVAPDPLRILHDLIVDCVEGRVPIPLALQVVECIPSALLREWAASMPETFSEQDNMQRRKSDRLVVNLEMWFHLLWRLDMRHNAGLSSESSIYQETFSSFAGKFFRDGYPPRTLVTALMYRLAAHVSLDGNEELHELFISHRPALVAQHEEGKSLIDMLASLTSALAEQDLPNHGVLELITPYLDEHKSFYSVSKLLERIKKRRTTISCPVFLDEYTKRVLEEVQNVPCPTRRARDLAGHERLLAARRALCISTAAQDAVIRQARARRNFEHILERANAARIMPLAYRKVTANITRDAQTDLIHQLASQYAMERTRGWQQNYRSLRYLYIYLTTYNLPIREAFTRAVVEICISRPLSENRHIAQERATWVCRLVARVEGVHRARLIWQLFWARRGDLILNSKTKLIQLGLHDRAHINTMRMLKMLPEHPEK